MSLIHSAQIHNVAEPNVLHDTLIALIVYMSSGGVLIWGSGGTLWSREWHVTIYLVSRGITNFIENFITRLFANIPGYVLMTQYYWLQLLINFLSMHNNVYESLHNRGREREMSALAISEVYYFDLQYRANAPAAVYQPHKAITRRLVIFGTRSQWISNEII